MLLTAPLVWNAHVTAQDIKGMAHPNFYRGGVEWLSQHADKGEIIFNTDWDDIPKLFFYNPDLAYISGLDILHCQRQSDLTVARPCLDCLHGSPVRRKDCITTMLAASIKKRSEA